MYVCMYTYIHIHNNEQWLTNMSEQKTLTFTLTVPSNFCISPSMADMRELLPLPTVPTMATRLPSGISTETLLKQF